jgi:hypothetical protein
MMLARRIEQEVQFRADEYCSMVPTKVEPVLLLPPFGLQKQIPNQRRGVI